MKVPRYLRLLAKPQALDFERARHELRTLIVQPWDIMKEVQSHHRATGRWCRDDPAFAVLTFAIILSFCVPWGAVIYRSLPILCTLLLNSVIYELLLLSLVIPSVLSFVCNKLMQSRSPHQLTKRVEWTYFFDVHCNAYLFFDFYMSIIQFVLHPILKHSNWGSLMLTNLICLVAYIHYSLITLLGISVLPIWTAKVTVQRLAISLVSGLTFACLLFTICAARFSI